MLIQLTRGKSTVIDDEDWDLVKGYRWTANKSGDRFYAIARWMQDGKQRHVLMHRLILGASDPKLLVDHKDTNSLNNRRENLRFCCHAENMRNSRVRSHSSSGVKNVMRMKKDGVFRWFAVVIVDKKRHRKAFDTIEEATACAEEMRKRFHGEFAAPIEATKR